QSPHESPAGLAHYDDSHQADGTSWRDCTTQRDGPSRLGMCTSGLLWAAFPTVLAVTRRWSANRRFSRMARPGGPRTPWFVRGRVAGTGLASGGRQVPPLVFTTWDSATRNGRHDGRGQLR